MRGEGDSDRGVRGDAAALEDGRGEAERARVLSMDGSSTTCSLHWRFFSLRALLAPPVVLPMWLWRVNSAGTGRLAAGM